VEKVILLVGNVAAIVGLTMCLGAGLFRLLGNYHLFGYSSMTVFMAGTGLLVMACLAKLEVLLLRSRT
jgi:hypothetical protein